MKQLSQGAEAKIYLDKDIVKDRFKKSYRLEEIDTKLRKFRTRRETKILTKLHEINFPVPKLIESDDKSMKIKMEYLDGKKVRDMLEESDYKKICKEIGKLIAVMHDNGIIHGDLTTSNMVFTDKVNFIDFGLSYFSDRTEDKAVDLHLLRQALESKHYRVWEDCFKAALKGYEKSEDYKTTMTRLEKVEARGRNKQKS
jgi:TP53 regulating kinase-like protein